MTAKSAGKRKATPKPKPKKPKSTAAKKKIRIKTGDRGRPTDFREEYIDHAKKLCLLGFTNVQIAEVFDITEPTLYRWQLANPELRIAMNTGKAIADAEIANSLYNRAKGMVLPDCHVSNFQGDITITPLEKHIAPDTLAAKFWLKNRQPELWRENIGVTDGNGGAFGIVINEFLKPQEAKP